MNTPLAPILSATSLIVIMVLIAWVLIRKRNMIHARFGRPDGTRRIIEIGGGMRIAVVEIDGQRVACAMGRHGITAMQILGEVDKAAGT